VGRVESLPAILERQLIRGLVLEIAHAETEGERLRHVAALTDLIRHSDPTLDPTLLDMWAQAYLQRSGLYVWSECADDGYFAQVNQFTASEAPDPLNGAAQERN
jgi:hypothetical protein